MQRLKPLCTIEYLIEPVPFAEELIAKLQQYRSRALSLEEWLTTIRENRRFEVMAALEARGAVSGSKIKYATNDPTNSSNTGPPKIDLITKLIKALPNNDIEYLRKHYIDQQPIIKINLENNTH